MFKIKDCEEEEKKQCKHTRKIWKLLQSWGMPLIYPFSIFGGKKESNLTYVQRLFFFTWSWRTLKMRKNSKFKAKKIFIAIKTKTSKSASFYFQKPKSNGFNVRMFFLDEEFHAFFVWIFEFRISNIFEKLDKKRRKFFCWWCRTFCAKRHSIFFFRKKFP